MNQTFYVIATQASLETADGRIYLDRLHAEQTCEQMNAGLHEDCPWKPETPWAVYAVGAYVWAAKPTQPKVRGELA